MHKFTIMGLDNRVSKELKVETKTSSSGKSYEVATFDVACGNGSYKDANGNWQKRPATYFTIKTQVPYLVEKLKKNCKKGIICNLTGEPTTWSVKKADGSYANGFYVLIEQGDVLELFETVHANNAGTQTEVQTEPEVDYNNVDISNDDLPFDI